MQAMITDYQSKYIAYDLTRRRSSDSTERLAVAVAGAQVDMNPHQVDAALFAFASPLSKGALLADEVGLGKTIEAGLVISQRWAERQRRTAIMADCIAQLTQDLAVAHRPDPWGPDIKVTDKFLDPLFENFYQRRGTPQQTYKRDYHRLSEVIPLEQIAPEVIQMLDAILEVANRATPAQ